MYLRTMNQYVYSVQCHQLCTYLSSFIAICSGSVSPSNSTITGAHILQSKATDDCIIIYCHHN